MFFYDFNEDMQRYNCITASVLSMAQEIQRHIAAISVSVFAEYKYTLFMGLSQIYCAYNELYLEIMKWYNWTLF